MRNGFCSYLGFSHIVFQRPLRGGCLRFVQNKFFMLKSKIFRSSFLCYKQKDPKTLILSRFSDLAENSYLNLDCTLRMHVYITRYQL